MELHNITKIIGNRKKSKRVGRGYGSGKGGHTVGRGNKGQKARSGNKRLQGFEGGQVPLYKRLPQIGGFKKLNSKKVLNISINDLNKFKDGSIVSVKELIRKKIIFPSSHKYDVKVLSNGILKNKLTLVGFKYTNSAKIALEKAGCTIKD